jgi:cell division protein FtsB
LAWIAVLLIIGVFLAVQVGRQVYASWSIGQEADAIRARIAAMEAHNEALRQELAFLQSKGFVGAEARRLLNLGLPGEHVLIIPPGAETALPPALRDQPAPVKPPLEQWLELFFGP